MATKNYGLIKSVEQLAGLVDKIIADGEPFGFDIETGYDGPDKEGASLHPEDPVSKVVGFSFTNSLDWARYVPIAHDLAQNLDTVETAKILWRLLRTGLGIAHNAKFERRHLRRWFLENLADCHDPIPGTDRTYAQEVRPAGKPECEHGYFPVFSDTMIEAYLVAEEPSYALKPLTKSLFGHDQQEISTLFPDLTKKALKSLRFNTLELTSAVVDYACEDALWCLAIHRKYFPLVKDRMLYKVEMAIMPILCEMEDFGVKYDWPVMAAANTEGLAFLEKMNAEVQATLSAMAGTTVNVSLGSPAQIADILFGTLKMKSVLNSKKTGKPSTNAIALTGLSKQYPVVKKILEWKEMRTLTSRYLTKYQAEYSYALDGLTHPSHMQTVVPSGRFAVADPPYQQTPKKYHYVLDSGEEFNLNFRSLIISPEGHYILGFDYSQIELRMLAGESGEPTLLAAFDKDEDVHTATAALMLGIPRESVTKDQRATGKTMNFALLYGMGAKSLGERLGISKEEAESLYNQYFSSYSAISLWVERQVQSGKKSGYVTTKFGRKITIRELQHEEKWIREKGERLCVNAPIQGAAADYMKISMVRARKALADAGMLDRVHLAMNIHDALEFYVHESLTPKQVIDVLAPAVVYKVPGLPKIVADWHIGRKWGALQEIEVLDDGSLKVKGGEKDEAISFEGDPDDEDATPVLSPEQVEALRQTANNVRPIREPAYSPNSADAFATTDAAAKAMPEYSESVPHEDHHSGTSLATVTPITSSVEGNGWASASEPGKRLVVTITDMPDEAQYRRFLDLIAQSRGNNTLLLKTPEGDLDYEGVTTGLSTDDQARISMCLGGAEVRWDAADIDAGALAAGLSF